MSANAFTEARACLFLVGLAAWVLAIVLAIYGKVLWFLMSMVFAFAIDFAGRIWSRKYPVPFPYRLNWVLRLPGRPLSPRHLQHILQPKDGERILEIGAGVGVHALQIARALLPNGVLDVLDAQHEMLDQLNSRATVSRLTNVVATQGDAQRLPYPNGTFDAAYIVSVLGEIQNPLAALRELRRVLKPTGRVIISELFIDPDFVSLQALKRKTSDAGFEFERSVGPIFAYFAVFHPAIT